MLVRDASRPADRSAPNTSTTRRTAAAVRLSGIAPITGVATCDNPLFGHATPSGRSRRCGGRAGERRHLVSRTYRDRPAGGTASRRVNRRWSGSREGFRCRHCGAYAGPLQFGGRHRNHCPHCLYSLHVDGRVPGDRASSCRSRMAPVGVFARRNGEQAIVHRCLGCGFERHCRVAADDDAAAVMRLAVVAARRSQRRASGDAMTA